MIDYVDSSRRVHPYPERRTELAVAATQGTPLGQESASGIENLHPVIGVVVVFGGVIAYMGIGYVYTFRKVHRDPERCIELTVATAAGAPIGQEFPISIENLHPGIAVVGNVDPS